MEETMGKLANRITATCEVTRGLVLGNRICVRCQLGAVEARGRRRRPRRRQSLPRRRSSQDACKGAGSSSTLVISSGTVCATLEGRSPTTSWLGTRLSWRVC